MIDGTGDLRAYLNYQRRERGLSWSGIALALQVRGVETDSNYLHAAIEYGATELDPEIASELISIYAGLQADAEYLDEQAENTEQSETPPVEELLAAVDNALGTLYRMRAVAQGAAYPGEIGPLLDDLGGEFGELERIIEPGPW